MCGAAAHPAEWLTLRRLAAGPGEGVEPRELHPLSAGLWYPRAAVLPCPAAPFHDVKCNLPPGQHSHLCMFTSDKWKQCPWEKTPTQIFKAALSVVAPNRKQPVSLATGEWVDRWWNTTIPGSAVQKLSAYAFNNVSGACVDQAKGARQKRQRVVWFHSYKMLKLEQVTCINGKEIGSCLDPRVWGDWLQRGTFRDVRNVWYLD